MTVYRTKQLEFDFLKNEIRVYRNRFNYLTIPFAELHHLEVKEGRPLRNVGLLTLIAGLLFLFTIVLMTNFYFRIESLDFTSLIHSDIRRIGVNIILLFSTAFGATYLCYSITRKEIILFLHDVKKTFNDTIYSS